MIRERVSTQGVIRPLEPEDELPATQVPHDLIGTVSERAIRRYIDGQQRFDKKFASAIKSIEKHRERNLARGSQDAYRRITRLQHYLEREREATDKPSATDATNAQGTGKEDEHRPGVKEGLLNASAGWSLAWALDADEKPPPSSIVARRDTQEALELARVADMAVLAEASEWSGNNLWSVVLNFLTAVPDKNKDKAAKQSHSNNQSSRKPSFGSFMRKKTEDAGRKAEKAPEVLT